MSEYRRILAENIKGLRESLGFNKSQFSRVFGINRSTLFRLEKAVKPQIDIDDLFTLVRLGLKIESVDHGEGLLSEETTEDFVNRIFRSDNEVLLKICSQTLYSLFKRELNA